jgi:hypothetical protein
MRGEQPLLLVVRSEGRHISSGQECNGAGCAL